MLLALAAAGCMNEAAKQVADLAEMRSEEVFAAFSKSPEELMALIDPSATLDTILDDPLGALCSWVRIQGIVLSPDVVKDWFIDEDDLYLGRVDEEAGVYKVLHVSRRDSNAKPGDRVEAVGKFFCTQVQLEVNGRDVAAFEEHGYSYRLLTWWVVVLD